MATTQQIQIADDIVRYKNIMNDLLDFVSYQLRRINPDTGQAYLDREGNPFTHEQIQQFVHKNMVAVRNFKAIILDFVDKLGSQVVIDALQAVNITDLVGLKNEIINMDNVAGTVLNQVDKAANDTDFIAIASHIDANVEKLKLIRRRWPLQINGK